MTSKQPTHIDFPQPTHTDVPLQWELVANNVCYADYTDVCIRIELNNFYSAERSPVLCAWEKRETVKNIEFTDTQTSYNAG
jgi:hypothetical protein